MPGKLNLLAVTPRVRTKIARDVPTAINPGLSGMIFENFSGLFAQAGTPKPVVDQIAQATHTAMADDESGKADCVWLSSRMSIQALTRRVASSRNRSLAGHR